MTAPYSTSYQIFPAGTALTGTATLGPNGIGAGDIKFGGSVAFQYVGAAFSGTLAFEGRPHGSAAWVALPYVVLGAAPAPSVAQVSQTTNSSTITYIVLVPMEEMRVVMTRSAGSLAVYAHAFEHPLWAIAGPLPAGTNTIGVVRTEGLSYLNIPAGIATTVVKASAGVLHSIILNSAATASNTTVVYDNATGVGTVIARPAVTTATVPTTLLFDVAFANGLTIITAVAAGGDMTIAFR